MNELTVRIKTDKAQVCLEQILLQNPYPGKDWEFVVANVQLLEPRVYELEIELKEIKND